jgi:hypothetical protein
MRRFLFVLLVLVLPLRVWAGLGPDLAAQHHQHQQQHCIVPCQEMGSIDDHSQDKASASVQHDDCKPGFCCASIAVIFEAPPLEYGVNPMAVPAFTPARIVSAVIAHDVRPPIS